MQHDGYNGIVHHARETRVHSETESATKHTSTAAVQSVQPSQLEYNRSIALSTHYPRAEGTKSGLGLPYAIGDRCIGFATAHNTYTQQLGILLDDSKACVRSLAGFTSNRYIMIFVLGWRQRILQGKRKRSQQTATIVAFTSAVATVLYYR